LLLFINLVPKIIDKSMTKDTGKIINNLTELQMSPFNLNHPEAYAAWREQKLASYPINKTELVVNIESLDGITLDQQHQLIERCNVANMAVYQCADKTVDTKKLRNFAAKFGLNQLDHHLCTEQDGVSVLTVSDDGPKEEFIPYSNRPIGWHTDGYYNDFEQRIYALMLHCEQPALEGGENALLDHEIAYIKLRDMNPDYIAALMQPDCMTIPAFNNNGMLMRPERTGPVFDLIPGLDKLFMRFTARKRNIAWKDDPLVHEAVAALMDIMNDENSPVFFHTLEAGQGLISNNVLHTRTGFVDDPENHRRLYRARFLDRVKAI